jgi:hypothetical protein
VIGLLDPALFLPRPDSEVERDFDRVAQSCRNHDIQLAALNEYWPALWNELARPLEQRLGPQARRALQQIRRLGDAANRHVPELAPHAGKAWRAGFRQLFEYSALGTSWEERMVRAVVRAALSGEQVIVLVRRMVGRNLVVHASGGTTLDENTRWALHVQPRGIGHRQILCVYDNRNLIEPWTTRFDWRLPGSSDGARYPFCPPDRWWKGSTSAHRTVESRPAWLDKHNNAWARPNIPGGAGYHWDVYVHAPTLKEAVGLDQINVVQFGAPLTEGRAGHLHHIPDDRVGRPTGKGWCC